jgi:hypothetical protein
MFSGLTLMFGAFFVPVAHAGFGITPPYVRNDALRPGSEYTQEIIIVRSDPVEDLNAELTLNLPGIEDWFSFDRGMRFILPRGESQVRMNVTVRVPEDAKLADYKGNIRIRTSSLQAPTTGVSLALGAQIDVMLSVREEIYDFEVRRVELFEAEEGYKKWWLDFPGKIKFAIHMENTGNVPAAPAKVVFEIFDTTGQRLLETTENTNRIEQILPFTTKRVFAYLPTRLPPGSYRVRYDIVKNSEYSAQKGELAFTILPRGTISNYEGYGFEGLSTGDKLSVVLPPLFLVGVFFLFLTLRRGRLRRVRQRREERRDDDDDAPPQRRVVPREPPKRIDTSGVVDLSRRR